MIEIFLFLNLIFNLISIFIMIFLGAFLVKFRDRMNQMFSDFLAVLKEPFSSEAPPASNEENQESRTWDEKYERELEAIQKRLRAETNLINLPDPVVSYGQPPAPNLSNLKDLNVKDV